jgi:hypothetical protein
MKNNWLRRSLEWPINPPHGRAAFDPGREEFGIGAIGLQFGAYLLLAFGFAPGGEAAQPRRKKGNRKRKPRNALAPKTASTANVVAFQPSAKQS